ncbi:MAG: UvrD-helicase domain-containing protein [Alphaproteobacteria bacterium]|nr:UvrD-helicase domain-containing protein [Alphaproteobacteria bacterium]
MSDPFHIEEPQETGVSEVASPPWLAQLNEPQREAVETLEGPVLVLAGAGTGKTRVLTTRLAHLLRLGRARPYQVLAVTFTNKAAREMRERVADLVGGPAEAIWLGTFHALGARILRRHAELVGLKDNFTILDADDQVRLLKQLLEAENIDDKRWPARVLMGVIQRWKDRALTPDKVSAADAGDLAGGRLVDLYRGYQERLKTLNAADFGDLLLHNLTIFGENPEVLAEYQDRFEYILVDEYQDTNVAQYLWLRLLAQKHKNIACVGDDDQSIYAWRGAEVGNILRFEEDFPGAKIVRLEQNYRSTGPILGAASGLIAKNEGRLGKTLWTEAEGGERVTVNGVWDGEEEARVVSDRIEDIQRKGDDDGKAVPLNEIAILVRAGFQTREFEERFLTLGLPYRVVGGPRFYERMELRDALAYLRVIQQPDDDLAFERIINKPKRGIGNTTVQTLYAAARASGISLYRAASEIVTTDELRPNIRSSLAGLVTDFERWRALNGDGRDGLPHPELAEMVLDESGYTEMLMNDKSPEAPGRLENLKELIVAMEEFDNLAGFLEHVSLVMENTEAAGSDLVNIMTLHSAKGLEFDTVFLPGWEEGLFPHQRNMDENGLAGLEEERRLAYVGLTRAKREATILFAANRRVHGQWQSAIPSRFIDELPPEHVEVESDQGLYSGGDRFSASRSLGYGGGGYAGSSYGGGYGAGRMRTPDRDAEATLIHAEPQGYGVGERVFHQKFGYGHITAIDDNKLAISFDKAGDKKVLDSFVVPADSV